jgi:hypothetical protein
VVEALREGKEGYAPQVEFVPPAVRAESDLPVPVRAVKAG